MKNRHSLIPVYFFILMMPISVLCGFPVLAEDYHEDPDTAQVIFNASSLFEYQSTSLDLVIQGNTDQVSGRAQVMPFANIPDSLQTPIDAFATGSSSLSGMMQEIDQALEQLRVLIEQSRLDETEDLSQQIDTTITKAFTELERVHESVVTEGEDFEVASTAGDSLTQKSYNGLLARIDTIRSMLSSYRKVLGGLSSSAENLKPATLTLEISPCDVFIGDDIEFKGVLTANNTFLAGRKIEILLNGSSNVIIETDSGGHYLGTLKMPYRYIPEVDCRALYYPRDADVGVYLAALSSTVTVKTRFYEADLQLAAGSKAYPGLETEITGHLDYGQYPVSQAREGEIYLDEVLVGTVTAGSSFSKKIKLGPDINTGKHVITVLLPADKRYAPVMASTLIDVTKKTPELYLLTPVLGFIPGGMDIRGRLTSGEDPLPGARVVVESGNTTKETVTAVDGSFEVRLTRGVEAGLIGSQKVTVQVYPEEPWNYPVNITRSIFMMNIICCAAVLVLVVLAAIYVPARMRSRLGGRVIRRRPAGVRPLKENAPTGATTGVKMSVPDGNISSFEPNTDETVRNRILRRYRLLVILIEKMASVVLKPNQTLREFAQDNAAVLGPLSKYFIEFTREVERVLYSPYRPSESDEKNSEKLAGSLEEGLKR
jgi:hypothetical protein